MIGVVCFMPCQVGPAATQSSEPSEDDSQESAKDPATDVLMLMSEGVCGRNWRMVSALQGAEDAGVRNA